MAYYKRREVFLMSLEEERKIVFPLYHSYFEIHRKYRDGNGNTLEEQRAQERREVCAAFRESNVNLEAAKQLAQRLTTQKWYCAYYTGHNETSTVAAEDAAPYSLILSDNPSEVRPLSFREYGEFYAMLDPDAQGTSSSIKFWAKARKALHIPKDFVYVNLGALEVLFAVLEMGNTTEEEALISALPSIFSRRVDSVTIPVDKLNSVIWTMNPKQIDGQLSLNIEMGKPNEQAIVYYAIAFEDLQEDFKISRKLEPYDRLVYEAISALYNDERNTQKIISIGQIYHIMMGYDKKASNLDTKKIDESITKMSRAHITIDNEGESTHHKHRVHQVYDAPLLPCERVRGYINGQLVNGLIHMLREPPAMSFAKARNQITSVTPEQLQLPLNKTNTNLQLQHYLIDRIAKIKAGNSPNKVLLSTIFEKCDITTAKEQLRARDKIVRILDHLQETGFFDGYKLAKDKKSLLIEVKEGPKKCPKRKPAKPYGTK